MTINKFPTPPVLREELKKGELSRTYLFMGEEKGEKEKYISLILDILFKDTPDRSNCTARYHIENNEFDQAADFLLSQSIFYPARACILYNINTLKQDEHNGLLLDEVFSSMADSMTLIMTSDLNSPPPFLAGDFLKKIRAVQFWRYFDRDIERYVAMTVKKMGISINNQVLSLMLELTGKDIKKIDDALEMLQSSCEDRVITEEALLAVVQDQRETNIFEFIDALFTNNKKTLGFLDKILSEGTPELLILNMILRQGETIELYHALTEEGLSSEDALNKCGVLQRKKDSFWKMIRAYDRERIRKIFPLIARADYELKSGGKSRDIVKNPLFSLVSEIQYLM